MNWKKYFQKMRYYAQYLPFTSNACVLAIALVLCFRLLGKEEAPQDAPSAFEPFLLLMGATALWFFLALIALSFLSTLACWLFYLLIRKKQDAALRFQFNTNQHISGIETTAFLNYARRPLLGTINARLVYDGFRLTGKLTLAGNQRKSRQFWREGITGAQAIRLPDIKEYSLKGSILYFEDMLQLFSFPVFQQQQGHFFQAPRKQQVIEKEVLPRQTRNAEIQIRESRPIPGDLLNYKNFESGDDVRRIVWKVYAKNRELVVRIPEQRDRLASHIYFYASFHTHFSPLLRENVFADELLNYFKNRVWSAFELLLRPDIPLKYIPDQILQTNENLPQAEAVQRTISNARWQSDRDIKDYFQSRYGAVICISSFNSPQDISDLLETCGQDTVVYYVRLSRAFHRFAALSWLQRIFLKAPGDRLKRVRGRWPFSPLRFQLMKKEKEIARIITKSNLAVELI
jgi:hypothetical protein